MAEFQWKQANEEMILPKNMETKHIVNTIYMLWNHVVSNNFKIDKLEEHTFDSSYNDQYMKDAFCHLIHELENRSISNG
jgi:hypothetical protein